ncbi:MAG TPA: 2-phospho-L-lactate transferase [Nitrososphaeraceae archaeon]
MYRRSLNLIVALAGGTGSVKLLRGLAAAVNDLIVISNVADNIWLHGVYVCPDLDTAIYGLANILNRINGWGIEQDTYSFLNQLAILGEATWFRLGDKDLATHVIRTKLLNEGKDLTEVTEFLRRKFKVKPRILPISNDHIETRLKTDCGDLHIQEFWVREKGRPNIRSIHYEGSHKGSASPIAINVLKKASAIVIAPANPISSIGPMLALKDFESELISMRNKVIAVSPFIGNKIISGPAEKYMKSVKLDASSLGVAMYYEKFLGKFVISKQDHRLAEEISNHNVAVFETDIVMNNRSDENSLAKYILANSR